MNHLRESVSITVLLLLALLMTACAGKGEELSGSHGILVATDWLQEHLNDPDLVILHAGTAGIFDSAHIPGARLIIPSDFTVNTDERSNQMPPADSIIELLRRVGVDNDSRIVLYPESARLLTRTARVFVALDYAGLGEQTFFLNGGLPAWEDEARVTSDVSTEFSAGNLELSKVKELVIEWPELDKQRWSNEVAVIDARTDTEYYGAAEEEEDTPEGGHIEGANFLPYQDLLREDRPYLFKADDELEELFNKAEASPDKETVVYCGSGVRASVSYLIARQLGYPALLYDGSYEEWSELDLPLTGPVRVPEKNE